MKRAEVIKAMNDSGASFEDCAELMKFVPIFERFAALVAAAERERVAVAVEKKLTEGRSPMGRMVAEYIRALGDE